MPSVLLRAIAGGEEGGSLLTLASASSVDSCKPSNDDDFLLRFYSQEHLFNRPLPSRTHSILAPSHQQHSPNNRFSSRIEEENVNFSYNRRLEKYFNAKHNLSNELIPDIAAVSGTCHA